MNLLTRNLLEYTISDYQSALNIGVHAGKLTDIFLGQGIKTYPGMHGSGALIWLHGSSPMTAPGRGNRCALSGRRHPDPGAGTLPPDPGSS